MQGLVECIGVVFLIKDIHTTLLVNVLQETIQHLKKPLDVSLAWQIFKNISVKSLYRSEGFLVCSTKAI